MAFLAFASSAGLLVAGLLTAASMYPVYRTKVLGHFATRTAWANAPFVELVVTVFFSILWICACAAVTSFGTCPTSLSICGPVNGSQAFGWLSWLLWSTSAVLLGLEWRTSVPKPPPPPPRTKTSAARKVKDSMPTRKSSGGKAAKAASPVPKGGGGKPAVQIVASSDGAVVSGEVKAGSAAQLAEEGCEAAAGDVEAPPPPPIASPEEGAEPGTPEKVAGSTA